VRQSRFLGRNAIVRIGRQGMTAHPRHGLGPRTHARCETAVADGPTRAGTNPASASNAFLSEGEGRHLPKPWRRTVEQHASCVGLGKGRYPFGSANRWLIPLAATASVQSPLAAPVKMKRRSSKNSLTKSATTARNLETRFGDGRDVLDYFDASRAVVTHDGARPGAGRKPAGNPARG